MTFPQIQCLLFKGKEPPHKVTSGSEILDWVRRVKEMTNREAG